jgi:hypothetical protein
VIEAQADVKYLRSSSPDLVPRVKGGRAEEQPSFPKNMYCLIFFTFFRDNINLVSSTVVRIENHEVDCLRAVTTCVYSEPLAGFPAAWDCGTAMSII